MYRIKLTPFTQKTPYQKLSVILKFLIDDEKLAKSLTDLEKIYNIKLSELQKKNFLSSDIKRIRITKPSGKPDALILQKIKTDDINTDYFRNHLAAFVANLQSEVTRNLYITIPSFSIVKKYFDSKEYYYQTFAEGVLLGNYSFDKYKKEQEKDKTLNVYLHPEDEKILRTALKKA
ncbi:MAG TPA: M17 family peptidase N-terminal domain-containing protein, partial [Ignavibacteriaceae bacterium]|nr:M17 family peptidase N-terminal domain-containing protein [Ignavibacteriaceae bacterium]